MTARRFFTMAEHVEHSAATDHPHGPTCGHPSVRHSGQHVDYLVDGHAHHAHEGHWDECDLQALEGQWEQPSR